MCNHIPKVVVTKTNKASYFDRHMFCRVRVWKRRGSCAGFDIRRVSSVIRRVSSVVGIVVLVPQVRSSAIRTFLVLHQPFEDAILVEVVIALFVGGPTDEIAVFVIEQTDCTLIAREIGCCRIDSRVAVVIFSVLYIASVVVVFVRFEFLLERTREK